MSLRTEQDAAEAWRTIRGNARSAKINLPAIHAKLAAESVALEYVISIYQQIRNSMNQLNALAATPGLNAYVKNVFNDPAYDVLAAIDTVTTAQQGALTWIDTNAAGLSLTGDTAENAIANGSVVTNRFSPEQTSALRALLLNISDAIS